MLLILKGEHSIKMNEIERSLVPDSNMFVTRSHVVFVSEKHLAMPNSAEQQREHGRLRAQGFHVVGLDSKNMVGII